MLTLTHCAQRINGRLAMWAFASIVAGEVGSQTPALEQVRQHLNDDKDTLIQQLLLPHAC